MYFLLGIVVEVENSAASKSLSGAMLFLLSITWINSREREPPMQRSEAFHWVNKKKGRENLMF